MINIAQIGVGYWGPNLLRNLVENPKCNIIRVVDLSEERQAYVKKTYPNIDTSNSIDDIINDPNIEAVVIATPVFTHYDLAMQCLGSGKNILVEKPLATKYEEIETISKIAKKNNLIAMVGHTFLYNSAVKYMKEVIDSGELGDIRYIYSQRLNLGRIREDVDALWNLAPHDISIVQYLLNDAEPLSIKRSGQSYVQKNIDDVVFLNLKYPKNILVNIHVSWLDPNKVRKMTVVGSKKMVVYDDIDKNKIKIYDKGIDKLAVLGKNMDFDSASNYEFYHRDGDVTIPKIEWVEPLKSEIAHFIDCISNNKNCLTDSFHAGKVVKILESIS